VIVLAIKNKREFRTLEPPAYLSKGALNIHGLFVRSSDNNYVLMRLEPLRGDPYSLVYHEYTHLLLSHSRTSIPLWLSEGLAEFYEHTEINDHGALFGEPNEKHLMLLRQEKLIPLATLFTVNEKSPYYVEEKKGAIFYAESWALAHYLTMKDYADKTSRIGEYTKLVSDQTDPVTAGSRAFGDLKKLQRLLELYIEQQSFNQFGTKLQVEIDDANFAVKSISRTQVEAV